MRRTFYVGLNTYFWFSSAINASNIYESELNQTSYDRLDYLISKIESIKFDKGMIRKSYILDKITETKGVCFTYSIYNNKDHKSIYKRDLVIWLLFRFCQLPMQSIGRELSINRNTCHKAVIRIEKKVLEDSSTFNELFSLINKIQ